MSFSNGLCLLGCLSVCPANALVRQIAVETAFISLPQLDLSTWQLHGDFYTFSFFLFSLIFFIFNGGGGGEGRGGGCVCVWGGGGGFQSFQGSK